MFLNGLFEKLLQIAKSDRGCLWSKALDLDADVCFDRFSCESSKVRRHPALYEEHAKPFQRIDVALDGLGRLICGLQWKFEATDQQGHV
jgi:hypothetical protein